MTPLWCYYIHYYINCILLKGEHHKLLQSKIQSNCDNSSLTLCLTVEINYFMVIPQTFRNSTCFLDRTISTNSLILDINMRLFIIFVISEFLKKILAKKTLKKNFFYPKLPINFMLHKVTSYQFLKVVEKYIHKEKKQDLLGNYPIYRSSHWRCSMKKSLLKISQSVGVSFLIK